MRMRSCARGLSLLELTIAMGLMAALTVGLFAMLHPAQGTFTAVPEAADLQQRLRVAVDTITRDLLVAGAGAFAGAGAGPLVQYFAPILPIRTGTSSDSLTLMYVPGTAVQTTMSAELTSSSERLQVAAGPGCPVGAAVCGVKAGMTLLVYDEVGHVDALNVSAVTAQYAEVSNLSRPIGNPRPVYGVGSKVVEAIVRKYWRKTIASPPSDQLMRDEAPVVDHLAGLTFEYFAEPEPPLLMAGRATYGPTPPPLALQTTAYPAGENCTFQVDAATHAHVPRLPPLNATGALVKLTPVQLTDGPWCPDEADANRWDADLLRIRKIGITVRVEAAGPRVPAREIRWEVSPRNLSRGG
jgi:hypothetical protein